MLFSETARQLGGNLKANVPQPCDGDGKRDLQRKWSGDSVAPRERGRCSYSPHGAYAQSKLALVLFTYRLQHLLTANGSHVTANVVDPGVVNTELYKHVFWVVKVAKWMTAWIFFKTPEEGASTTLYAAVSPEMEGAGGCYLYNEERTKSADVAYDEELQRRLWTESCKMVGIFDESSRVP
ncbi:PREDICTED: dehydrogenase/reductase SDR family member on chromosome X [Phaethon lepturus]|nr:PREDICTED: dehydrogenase/reductase SDR family member on chromosome X [Phaethon lepturus]